MALPAKLTEMQQWHNNRTYIAAVEIRRARLVKVLAWRRSLPFKPGKDGAPESTPVNPLEELPEPSRAVSRTEAGHTAFYNDRDPGCALSSIAVKSRTFYNELVKDTMARLRSQEPVMQHSQLRLRFLLDKAAEGFSAPTAQISGIFLLLCGYVHRSRQGP